MPRARPGGLRTLDSMSMKMTLVGGPLDGEQQLVQALNTNIGSVIFFNLPHYQTFASGTSTVADLGLEVEYRLARQGPPPVPANGDTWDTSWVFNFVPESYVVPPSPITPPVTPPVVAPAFISLAATTTVTVDGNASTGVYMTGETALDVEGDTSVIYTDSTVTMVAGSTLTAEPDELEILPPMVATAGLMETFTVLTPVAGYTAYWSAPMINLADGASLTSWADLSGHGWTLTPLSTAPKFYRTTTARLINGHPAVTFNGTSDTLVTATPINVPAAGAWTVFSVTQVAIKADYAFESGANTGFSGLVTDQGGNMLSVLFGNVTWNQFPTLTTPPLGQGHCEMVSWAGPGNPLNAQVDGVTASITPAQSPVGAGGRSYVGGDTGGPPTRYHNGQIGEVIVWPRALSSDEMNQMWAYAQQKWGTP